MRLAILTAMLATIACAGTPSAERTDERVAGARAFQHDYEAAIRDSETSFLTTIAAWYVAEGESAAFDVGRTRVGVSVRSDAVQLDIEGRHSSAGDADLIPIDAAGRWQLSISRQDQGWRVLVHDREADARTAFAGLEWFPLDPGAIVEARFDPLAVREPSRLATSRGTTKTLYLAGVYRFTLAGRECELRAFAYEPRPTIGEPLLIPFRDRTTGDTSYGAGRYLEPSHGELVLDFNRATNPLCAYSEHYNCPMPPAFNQLDVAIAAGARAPTVH